MKTEDIKELGTSAPSAIQVMTVIGQIEGHQVLGEETKTTKYEHILPLVAAVEESEDVKGLLILLNTVGGDIEAGLAIAELLAVAAKHSFIAPSASMTIHPVRMNGTVIGVSQTYEYFARTQERIVRFVTANSHIRREKFLEYMLRTGELANDVGSIIDGQEAVSCGLMDSLGGLADALRWLHAAAREPEQYQTGPARNFSWNS